MSKHASRLIISDLYVEVEDRKIINGLSLKINAGELHVVMGPNGSGKSTLTYALLGHPDYHVTRGKISVNRKNILGLKTHERARLGILLAFQNPLAIPGVTISNFLRVAYRQMHPLSSFAVVDFHKEMVRTMEKLGLDPQVAKRSINEGFSGGEKKKMEMLQLLMLKPKFAIFDEIDTGLDVDALKTVSTGVESLKSGGCAVLLITHYKRILSHVTLDTVHIMKQGALVAKGGQDLVDQIEKEGYDSV